MKLKKLIEEFKDGIKHNGIYFQIFKNPTIKDFKDIKGDYFRGIVSNNGNLYLVDNNEDILHNSLGILFDKANLLDYNKNWFYTFDTLNNFLCVASKDKKNWYLSESYQPEVMKNKKFNNKIEEYKNKMKKNGYNLINEKLQDDWNARLQKKLGKIGKT